MKKLSFVIIINVLLSMSVYASSWRIIANPFPRSMSKMITDSSNQRIILFGGGNYRMPGGQYFNDAWSLDLNTETWKLLTPTGSTPSTRIDVALAYDAMENRMLLFGGSMSDLFYNDLYILDLTIGSEDWIEATTSGTPPSDRGSATAIIDPINNRLIIFGGYHGSGPHFNNTYALDLNTFTWAQLTPTGTLPSLRASHGAIYDPNEHRMIVFGGNSQSQVMNNEVWSLDLTLGDEEWQQLYPSGGPPNPRSRFFYVYDNLHNEMIIGLGYRANRFEYHDDVWALNLTTLTWRHIIISSPVEGRRGVCGAYDHANQQVIVFGGDQSYGYYFGDTYVLTVDTLAITENYQGNVSISPYLKLSPNPSCLPCQINVFVPFTSNICLSIIDTSGRYINTLMKGKSTSGNYMIQWNGKDNKGRKVASGTYFINLEIDGESVVKKAVVIE